MELRRSLFHWSRAHLTPKNSIWAAGLMRFANLNLCLLLICLPSLFRSLSKMMIAETQVKAFCVLSSHFLLSSILSACPLPFFFSCSLLSSLYVSTQPYGITLCSTELFFFSITNHQCAMTNLFFKIVFQSFLWCLDLFQPPVVHFSYWWSNQASQFVWVIIFSFIS